MTTDELVTKYTPKPGKVLEYERQLWQARFSPCGKFLVACGYDGKIQRWGIDGDAFEPLEPIAGHNGWVQCIAFHNDQLISADSWGRLSCWNYAEPAPKPLWEHAEAHRGWIRGLSISPDGSQIASCGNDAIVRLWRTNDGQLQTEFGAHPTRIFSVCFHPDGKSLVTGDLEGVIRHWDVGKSKVVRQLDASALYRHDQIQECGGARHLAFSAVGDLLLCAGQKTPGGGFATGVPTVLLFDWTTGKQTQEMQVGGNDDGFVYDAGFHPAGFVIATASAFPGRGPFWFWQPGEPKPFYIGKELTNGHSINLHPNGSHLALLIDVSANGNGRQLKNGTYAGGRAKVQLMEIAAPATS
jgi:WD40 repeat protein